MIEPLTQAERAELRGLARASVLSLAATTALPPLPPLRGRLGEPAGAFVTVLLEGRLRGCIGTLAPTAGTPLPKGAAPLARVIRDMAIRAASKDLRFPPLTADEAASPDLEIEISVLTPPTPVRGPLPDAVHIGRHGLVIAGRGHRGLLLPQVAVDRDWTPTQFLDHTCLKAGLPAEAWKAPDTAISVFTAEVF